MRFSIFTTALVAFGLFAGVTAVPASPAAASGTTSQANLPASQALAVVNSLNSQVASVAADIKKSISGITTSSPASAKAAAAQQVTQQMSQLVSAIGSASKNVIGQANAPASSKMRRQNTGDTGALIQAITTLVDEIDSLIIEVLTALGLTSLVGPAMEVIGVVTTLIIDIAAVVVDILPFLGDIGQLLGGIGSLLSGIGSLIPKGA